MKKSVFSIFALCIASALFTACFGQDAPAEPVYVPTSISESASEPEPEPRSRFDEYAAQYEQENGVDLSSADEEKCSEFFAEMEAQAYTKEDALADKAATSEKNQTLLAQYIEYLDTPRHEACAFDKAVERVLLQIAESSYTHTEEQKELTLYGELNRKGFTPEDLEQWGCTNEYKDWYIEEYNRRDGEFLTEEELIIRETLTPEQWEESRKNAEASWQETQEEAARDLAEAKKWMEENFDLYGY